ncbi:MAG: radical SAM protein [Clostridia bacterium]|nr:radical SAM protein [Clostridia bacterium]
MDTTVSKPTYLFYKNGGDVREMLKKLPGAEPVPVSGEVTMAFLKGKEQARLVFALPNRQLAKATALCRGMPEAEVFVLPADVLPADASPIKIDPGKPRLDYMETEVSEFCNLNCRGCCDFSNLATEKKLYPFEEFRADLAALKGLFWGVEKIRLMGGEPLLNPALAAYAEETRAVFPDCDLRVVSNGLLLPKASEETLQRLRAAGVRFDISNYPPTRKKKKEIVSVLENAGIGYDLGFPMDFFFKNILAHPNADPEPAFQNCIFTHCHMMGHGRLAPCSYAYCIGRFNERFGTDYPENDYIDLHDPGMDGWEIARAFSRPHAFCRCCGKAIIPIRWKGHVSARAARPEDWQIRDGFLTTGVGPFIQRALKPAAAKLRGVIQRRNGG